LRRAKGNASLTWRVAHEAQKIVAISCQHHRDIGNGDGNSQGATRPE
jgi:hypothetical protein